MNLPIIETYLKINVVAKRVHHILLSTNTHLLFYAKHDEYIDTEKL